jgi:scavenger receptor class B, member 1
MEKRVILRCRSLDLAFDLIFTFSYTPTGKCLAEGLSDVTDCYYGFPIALSFPHFLDADPQLLENITGVTPNRTEHESYFIVNPVSL